MHEVGSEFALGMQPIPRLPDGHNGQAHGLTQNDACNDFGSQATFCQRTQRCWGTQVPGGRICSIRYRSTSSCRALRFLSAPMASPHWSAFVRIFVRHAGGNAHDLALASGVVRQPAPPSVSDASADVRQRFRAWGCDRLGRAKCVDWFLGGHPISGRGIKH